MSIENAKGNEKQLMALLDERKAIYHPILARALGGVAPALLLSHLISMTEKRTEGNAWVYQPLEELSEATGLTRIELINARKRLCASYVVVEKKTGLPMKVYLKVEFEKLYERLTEYMER